MKTVKATDENIKSVVAAEIKKLGLNADLDHIDVSEVKDMSGLFEDSKFTGDISKWNVSSVTDMRGMFSNSKFNGDITKWDVSNVINMVGMFYYSAFDGDISNWNVSNVEDMNWMFFGSVINCDISCWNVSKVRYSYVFMYKVKSKLTPPNFDNTQNSNFEFLLTNIYKDWLKNNKRYAKSKFYEIMRLESMKAQHRNICDIEITPLTQAILDEFSYFNYSHNRDAICW